VPGNRVAPSLILASASARRRDLLRSAGVSFEVRPSDADEQRQADEAPEDYARRVAAEKARQIAHQRRARGDRRPVLGADTVVVIDRQAIGKPTDRGDAAAMLRRLSGRTHRVLTAFCLIDADGGEQGQLVSTDVTFKTLEASEIERYLDRARWEDKAGAYAVQEHAAYMVREVRGSYSNVVGLPLCETLELLATAGISPHRDRQRG
jgi:septum formation protein